MLPNGRSSIVGTGAAYFIQVREPAKVLVTGAPLTFLNVSVYKISQVGSFDLKNWVGASGVAYTLNVDNGIVRSTQTGGRIY